MIKIKRSDDIITQNIKKAMIKRGYTNQQSFCDDLLTTPMLSDIFNGKRRTIENLILIADRLNCSLDYIVGISKVMDHDIDLQTISKNTGLSEDAIRMLSNDYNESEKKAINEMISSFFGKSFFSKLFIYLTDTSGSSLELTDDNILVVDKQKFYLVSCMSELETIKKYSEYMIDYYKDEIEELQGINETENKKSRAYYMNEIKIDNYLQIIEEKLMLESIKKELKRSPSDVELKTMLGMK